MTSAERIRATYELRPVDHLFRREFYFWPQALERWTSEGMPEDWRERDLFGFDPSPFVGQPVRLGWCDCPFAPAYEEKVLEDEGTTQIVQDSSGQIKRVIKGMAHGFMPVYLRNVVESREDWERDVRPRLDPDTPERWADFDRKMADVAARVAAGTHLLSVNAVGGYMYLRDLFGPEKLLLAFYDAPDLVHACMAQWLRLMAACITRVQDRAPLFRLFLAEDICYKTGPLISPAMFGQFLAPYYTELVETLRGRQAERLYFELDTDGNPDDLLPAYIACGLDAMEPFEVAAGCDVVATAEQYPSLVIAGGIDKRILAAGPDAIDRELERILPPMVARGGFHPTCDHGVPHDVSYANYCHYRQRALELDH